MVAFWGLLTGRGLQDSRPETGATQDEGEGIGAAELLDLAVSMDELKAEHYRRPRHQPILVNRRDALLLVAEGLVEGRDFEVYPDLPEELRR